MIPKSQQHQQKHTEFQNRKIWCRKSPHTKECVCARTNKNCTHKKKEVDKTQALQSCLIFRLFFNIIRFFFFISFCEFLLLLQLHLPPSSSSSSIVLVVLFTGTSFLSFLLIYLWLFVLFLILWLSVCVYVCVITSFLLLIHLKMHIKLIFCLKSPPRKLK